MTLANMLDIATKPRWAMGMLGTKNRQFGNIVGHVQGVSDMSKLSEWTASQFDPRLNWDDVAWIKKLWGGKLILKGIQDVEDARMALNSGADALIVSNHGGRQLDGAPAAFSLVAPVADAVGGRTEIICDGGVRRGSDIVKAVAAGATCAMAGRPYLYALGAGGERGVDRLLEWFHGDMVRTMNLIGCGDVSGLNRSYLAH
jgi:L-lactate dehydrogenase (cytochrome)